MRGSPVQSLRHSINLSREFFMSKFIRKYGAAGAALVAGGAAQAQSTDPATALAALQELSGTTNGYGPVLFGLALVATTIMIGVAWIKKGRGAAK